MQGAEHSEREIREEVEWRRGWTKGAGRADHAQKEEKLSNRSH